MKRLRFLGYSGATALSACAGHGVGAILPNTGAAASANARTSAGFMPAKPLPTIPLLGECRRFDGTTVPAGWATCDGSLLTIEQNASLFKILGTSAGGDGKKNFALPKFAAFRFVIAVSGATPATPAELAAFFTARAAQSRRVSAAAP